VTSFDLPPEKLGGYAGSSPRPADHASYWTDALAELGKVDPEARFVRQPHPAAGVECFDLTFWGVRGARVHAKYVRPRSHDRECPAVLMFHGYGASSGDWFDKLPYATQGYCVAALDCRGQGGTSQDAGVTDGTTLGGHIIRGLDDGAGNLLYRHIFLDCAQLARIIMALPEVDAGRVGVTGASQGGGLAVACAALDPRIRRLAVTYPFLTDYRRVWDMDLANQDAYQQIATYFRRHDPLHEREEVIFERLGYIDVQHLADRITAEVLFTIGMQDTVCPPSTQYAIYNKIRSAKRLRIYPDFGHEPLPGLADAIFAFMADLQPAGPAAGADVPAPSGMT
jgi:cephalosporin-C deacetylase